MSESGLGGVKSRTIVEEWQPYTTGREVVYRTRECLNIESILLLLLSFLGADRVGRGE